MLDDALSIGPNLVLQTRNVIPPLSKIAIEPNVPPSSIPRQHIRVFITDRLAVYALPIHFLSIVESHREPSGVLNSLAVVGQSNLLPQHGHAEHILALADYPRANAHGAALQSYLHPAVAFPSVRTALLLLDISTILLGLISLDTRTLEIDLNENKPLLALLSNGNATRSSLIAADARNLVVPIGSETATANSRAENNAVV